MLIRRRWRWALAFGLCMQMLPAFSQTTGNLQGNVTDASSLPIPGALVEVSSSVLIRPRQTSSDLEGRFQFLYLPPGVYTVLARLTGFQDAVRPEVRVSLGETITVPLTLPLTVATLVTVSDETPLIDTVGAKIGISATEQMLGSLPLGRNFASIASIVGGTGTDILGPTFYGASSLENAFLVEGVNVTGIKLGGQGKFLPLDFVHEVEVRTSGYEAEFGRALGGNINVITKSGGNDFHATAFGYYDSGSVASSDQHDADRDAINQDRFVLPRRFDFGLSLGGYLIRNRLWFFGAYDRGQIDQDYLGVVSLSYLPTGVQSNFQEEADQTSNDLFAANLTWAPSVTHFFVFSVFGDPAHYRGRFSNGPGFAGDNNFLVPGPESARVIDRRAGGTDIAARWDGFFSKISVQAQYGYHEEMSRDRSDFANQPAIAEFRLNRVQYAAGSGPLRLTDESYRRSVFRLSGAASVGGHDIKLGLDFENEKSNRTSQFGGAELIRRRLRSDGALRVAGHGYLVTLPPNCTVLTDGRTGSFGFVDPKACNAWQKAGSVRSDFPAKDLSFFVQESYRPFPNVTINAGLRYDFQELVDTTGAVRLKLTDQWSPRFSVAWDPGGAGRSKVFASFGRYYQVIPQDLQARIMSNFAYSYAYNSSPGLDPVNDPAFEYPSALFGASYVPDGLKGPYQDEVVAGAELQLGASWSVGLRGTYRALGRALEDRCDVADPRAGIAGELPPGLDQNLTSCVLMNPGEGPLGQLRDPSNPDCFSDYPADQEPRPCDSVRARRYYKGVEVSVQHRPTKQLYLLANYMYSRLTGNYEGSISSSFRGNGTFQVSPNLSADFDYIDTLPNDSGRLLNDRTHQFKVSGYYSLSFGLSGGLVASYFSGQPLSLYGNVPNSNYKRFLVPRGTYDELPSTYSVDLHLQYAFNLGAASVVPILDVFNVTNVQRATLRNQVYDTRSTAGQTKPPFTNATNPFFGKDVAWQSPRLVRLGLKVVF